MTWFAISAKWRETPESFRYRYQGNDFDVVKTLK